MRGSRIRHSFVAVCATAACMAVGSSAALADTTHVFEHYLDIPGAEEVQPVDTDAQGNLLDLAQRHQRPDQGRPERQPGQLQRPGHERARRRRQLRMPQNAVRLRPGADHQRIPERHQLHRRHPQHRRRSTIPTARRAATSTSPTTTATSTDANRPRPTSSPPPADTWASSTKPSPSRTSLPQGLVEGRRQRGLRRRRVRRRRLRAQPCRTSTATSPLDGNPAHTQFAGQIRAACANSICVAQRGLLHRRGRRCPLLLRQGRRHHPWQLRHLHEVQDVRVPPPRGRIRGIRRLQP